MRIYGPNGTALGTANGNVKRTSSTGFSLPDAAATPESRAAVAPKAAANIDALLALQGVEEDPAERCRRQPQILIRRPRPRHGAGRDRATGRSRTGQGRSVLRAAVPRAQF